MRIVCPACEATYDVPDRLIGTGRSLRCRKCAHQWQVQPPPAALPPDPPPIAMPPLALPADRPVAPRGFDPLPDAAPAERPRYSLRAAWALSIVIVVGFVAALWLFRAEVTAAWPPAARLFLLFGTATG